MSEGESSADADAGDGECGDAESCESEGYETGESQVYDLSDHPDYESQHDGHDDPEEGGLEEKVGKLKAQKDGVTVIIRNDAEHSDDIEFYFEVKEDYFFPEFNGHYNMLGGGEEECDKDTLATLIREITEEVADPEARDIIIKNIRDIIFVYEYDVPGYEVSEVVTYESVISNPHEWDIVKQATLHGDGEENATVKLSELEGKPYAYGTGMTLKDYVKELTGKDMNIQNSTYGRYNQLDPEESTMLHPWSRKALGLDYNMPSYSLKTPSLSLKAA
ncbi:MAG: hypothetical protein ABIH34_04030 [Nanoarchaeota archaeon]